MNKFTKERLEEIAELAGKAKCKPCAMHMTNLLAVCDSEVIEEMARQLLASMKQKPVGYYREATDGDSYYLASTKGPRPGAIPLYAAPQLPQPAVPDENTTDRSTYYRAGWNACRAAMIQGAGPVQRWIPCSEQMPEDAQWCAVNTEYGYYVQCWSDGQGWLGDDISIPKCDVTHWMPLPAAPQQEAKK